MYPTFAQSVSIRKGERESSIGVYTAYVKRGIAGILEGHHLASIGNVRTLFPEAVDFATVADTVMARVVTWYRCF